MEPSEVAAQMVCCLQGVTPGAKPLLKCTAGHICAEAYSSAPDHMGPADHALTGAHITSGRTSLHLTVQSDACLLDVQFGVLQGLKQMRPNVALLDSLLGETTTVSSSKCPGGFPILCQPTLLKESINHLSVHIS